GLLIANDIEGDEDVVGDTGIDESFRLADLLAGYAGSAGIDLHFGDRRNLVGLDVRTVGAAMTGDLLLDTGDVVLKPVEIDGDRRRVEVFYRLHGHLLGITEQEKVTYQTGARQERAVRRRRRFRQRRWFSPKFGHPWHSRATDPCAFPRP